jgi:cbb3-type cytochrome oxidase subunit 3
MVIVFLSVVAYLFLLFRILFHGFRIFSSPALTIALLTFALALIIWAYVNSLRKRADAAVGKFSAPAADDSGSFSFRVAGTTFPNEDGESRQAILRHLKFGDAPWADDPEDLLATIEETSIDGRQAFAVLVNGYQVGFVPKSMISRVAAAREHVATCFVSSVRIVGGGTDPDGNPLNYGCEITLDF